MKRLVYSVAAFMALSALVVVPFAASADEPVKVSIELGKKLFNDPTLGTNGRSCATCHISDEKIAALADKKVWFGGEAKTLEQAINICIKGPLEGTQLPEDSVEIKSIAQYMKSLIK